MNKKKLKFKILERIYQQEAKKTFFRIFLWFFFVISILFFSFFLHQVIFEILREQQSFNLLEILSENIDVFRYYFLSNLISFYQEIPKLLFFLYLVSFLLLLRLFLIFKKNFYKIKNKVKSIYQFYKNKKYEKN